MKYYIVSDTHGYYTELVEALTNKGFFNDTEPHKLILCGDAFDRGGEAVKLQNFLVELLRKDELIYIKGNHEDLMEELLNTLGNPLVVKGLLWGYSKHIHNGTFDTAIQLLSNKNLIESFCINSKPFVNDIKESPMYKKLFPSMVDYFETENYIFVHGWIPCTPKWRKASKEKWDEARWLNGIEMACGKGIIEPDKTIVCGHFHASYGHSKYGLYETSEFGKDAVFEPFYSKGIIAIDACTAHTGKVNCIVIEDNPLEGESS